MVIQALNKRHQFGHFIRIGIFCVSFFFFILQGCTQKPAGDSNPSGSLQSKSVQNIQIDGSSTVYPLTEAVAEEYQAVNRDIRVTVGVSGTGGGMKKFIAKEIDITGASRPIKPSEIEKAKAANLTYTELEVAFDGLSVVVNGKNDFVDYLTVGELEEIWKAGSQVKTWKDVRSSWPDQKIMLYGPGTDSGTFDYFTETILGKSGAIRPDFTASESDHVLVQGVAGDSASLGFFGYAYYLENKDKLKIVPIDGGSGPIAPSMVTIKDGSYAPLSRPIYIYVSNEALTKPWVKAFISFYLESASTLAQEVGYVSLDNKTLAAQVAKVD